METMQLATHIIAWQKPVTRLSVNKITQKRTQVKHVLQRKLYCQWQRGNFQKGFFLKPHYIVFWSWFKQSNTGFKSTYCIVLSVGLSSYSPAGLKTNILLQNNGQRNPSSYNFWHIQSQSVDHEPCTCWTSAWPSLGNQCHGVFPIKRNDTFIKPQAWLLHKDTLTDTMAL